MVSVQFCKNFIWPSFCGGQTKKTSNFKQIFLLIVAVKKLFRRVYCCFRVLVIKLIKTIFNEMNYQLQRPVILTIVDFYNQIFQIWQTFAQIIDSLKINFKEKAVNKKTHFLKTRYFVIGGYSQRMLACFGRFLQAF